MSNNDSSSYTLRFNEVTGSLEYTRGLDWVTVPGVGSSITAGEINSETATNGQVLTADGAGGASWQNSGGGGTPAGADTQIQYNNTGAFGASSGLTWDNGQQALVVTNGYFRGISDSYLELNSGDNHIVAKPDAGEIDIVTDGGFPSFFVDNGTGFGAMSLSSTDNNMRLVAGTGIEILPASTKGVFISHSTGGADACASLHFETSGQGVILPRMDTTTRDAIASPSEGLIIYNTTTHVLNFYNGTTWGAV